MASPIHAPNHINRNPVKVDNFAEIKKILLLVLMHWYLFIIFVPIGLGAAWLYDRYTVPRYRASITMLFNLNRERAFSASVLTEGFGLSPEMRTFENQSFIIRSHEMVLRAINRLDFAVSYHAKGRFRDSEIYTNAPFRIQFDSIHPQLLNTPFNISFVPNGMVQVSVKTEGAPLHVFSDVRNAGNSGFVNFEKTVILGEKISTPNFSFAVVPIHDNQVIENGNYFVEFNSHSSIASNFRGSLGVSSYREGSSIIFVSSTGLQPQKLVRFLDVFSEEIVKDNLERKNDMATRSIDFIQRQLLQVADTLKITQQQLMDFRRDNKFMMPTEVSQRLSAEFFTLESERRQLVVSLDYFKIIKQKLVDNSLDENDYLLPAFSSETAGVIQTVVSEHTALLKEYNLIAGQAGASNPFQQELEKKIEMSRTSLLVAIDKQMESIVLQSNEIDSQVRFMSSRIGDLPELERDFLALERSHKLNDAIYTFLLQKSSEMQIAKASNVPDNEILDRASLSGVISPNTRSFYTRGLMFALIIPIILIALKEFFNTRIRTREEVVSLFPEIPVVGSIIKNKDGVENVVLAHGNSVVAETFRSLRARLKFLLSQSPGKIISITSTNTGEGKTFCAVNLASVFAISGKKTLLIGFDLRKPRLSAIFGLTYHPGVSNYLIGQVELNEIIRTTNHEHLFVIPAGVVPPNPSELISNAKTQELFVELRSMFDIIIIDTPPVGLVSDGRILMDLADTHLYVVRAGVTHKEHLALTLSNLISEKVPCMGILMNDVVSSPEGYGYYGSGYFSQGGAG